MTIFAVLLPEPQPALAEAIRSAFPDDHYWITDTQWLVSARGTAADVTAKLGIYDVRNPDRSPTGSAIVFATSSYFGRAPAEIWDWIKAELEAPAHA